ncbi:MAG TPA: GNAT family N-acetyltransferase [Solirubrobacteraceae bacterium]|jgi:GNAT superfamily N-acetyltransferase|nr:GNAT family N-acetyltransferase [Solirubrobacteraceae bacterium]
MTSAVASSTRVMVREAVPEERVGVVATVVAAFAQDPAWAFILGEDYERLAPHFAGSLFDLRVARRNVWVSDDLAAVAMWDSPDAGDSDTDARSVWSRYRATAGEVSFKRLAQYNDAVAAADSSESHWYLGVLATDPERRRQGLATAVMTPILAQADRLGIACCLETSTVENRRFYRGRGFDEATEIVLPGGPTTWWLRRSPTPARGE